MDMRPLIGITMGDPTGIGPEIIVTALADTAWHEQCRPLVIGDVDILKNAARLVGRPTAFNPISAPVDGLYQPDIIDVFNPAAPFSRPVKWGRPTVETGRNMERYIIAAADLAMNGTINAMVTAPINKEALRLGGSRFTGHTEMLAERTRTRRYAMMLAGEKLRVVLVTIHIPLAAVPGALTREAILTTIELTAENLRDRFDLAGPRIAVAGLNPHAGEGGLFGDEEERLIRPAVQMATGTTGLEIAGPLPPDTVFAAAAAGRYDAVVCMYHDQGLIPLKLLHFSDGVNITLGLPIIRISVDHGTAYDIAGKGRADDASLKAALRMAVRMAGSARQTNQGRTQA